MKHLKSNKGKFATFLNGKGFYLVLLVCIAAVGISGYILFFGDSNDPNTLLDLSTVSQAPPPSPAITLPSEQPLQTEIPSGARNNTEVVMSNREPAAPDLDVSSTVDADDTVGEPLGTAAEVAGDAEIADNRTPDVPTAAFYVWPLNGEVSAAFSIDELVFSNTMEDWRVHTGCDIAASLGASVKAIGDGTVEDVYNDDMMGTTVLINHNNGTRSVYRSLMETVSVAIDDEVFAGDVIGTVGRTADAEIAEPPHLHLEVIREGAQIDPLSILP